MDGVENAILATCWATCLAANALFALKQMWPALDRFVNNTPPAAEHAGGDDRALTAVGVGAVRLDTGSSGSRWLCWRSRTRGEEDDERRKFRGLHRLEPVRGAAFRRSRCGRAPTRLPRSIRPCCCCCCTYATSLLRSVPVHILCAIFAVALSICGIGSGWPVARPHRSTVGRRRLRLPSQRRAGLADSTRGSICCACMYRCAADCIARRQIAALDRIVDNAEARL
jgi:hypothetical protein